MPLYPPSSSSTSAVPLEIANGSTFTVQDNTQVLFANPIIGDANSIILITGNSSLIWIN